MSLSAYDTEEKFLAEVDKAEGFIGRYLTPDELDLFVKATTIGGDDPLWWPRNQEDWNREVAAAEERKVKFLRSLVSCECGSEKAKLPTHSTWCKKFEG